MTDHYGDQNVPSKQLVQPDNLRTGKEKKMKTKSGKSQRINYSKTEGFDGLRTVKSCVHLNQIQISPNKNWPCVLIKLLGLFLKKKTFNNNLFEHK